MASCACLMKSRTGSGAGSTGHELGVYKVFVIRLTSRSVVELSQDSRLKDRIALEGGPPCARKCIELHKPFRMVRRPAKNGSGIAKRSDRP